MTRRSFDLTNAPAGATHYDPASETWIKAENDRLRFWESQIGQWVRSCRSEMHAQSVEMPTFPTHEDWEHGEQRMGIIGPNGNTGEHYDGPADEDGSPTNNIPVMDIYAAPASAAQQYALANATRCPHTEATTEELKAFDELLGGPVQAETAFPSEGYEKLHDVYRDAHDQAAYHKGAERHANDRPFHKQRMQTISEGLNTADGMAYQVVKKVQEGLQMSDAGARRRELLGALNYLAGVVIFLDSKEG